jgi:hypothetical protein
MKAFLILSALLAGCATKADSDRAALKEELKNEILAELREPSPERTPDSGATGHVEGRIVLQTQGVTGCRVKLVRLLVSDNFLGMFEEVRRGVEFNTISEADGHYVFRDVPSGPYRLLWKPPGDTGWIRRLREKPDATVEASKTARVRDVDLDRKPVGTSTP